MPSGWTRWLFEQFEFPFEVVYPPRLDQGNLDRDFDVLVFPTGAIPGVSAEGGSSRYFSRGIDPEDREIEPVNNTQGGILVSIPAEFMIGTLIFCGCIVGTPILIIIIRKRKNSI